MGFLQQLDRLTLEHDMYLVSVDVESLYMSIDQKHGLSAAKFFLKISNLDCDLISLLLLLLKFILEHNYFTFRDQFYLQVHRTTTGATCALPYFNLFLFMLEHEVVQ